MLRRSITRYLWVAYAGGTLLTGWVVSLGVQELLAAQVFKVAPGAKAASDDDKKADDKKKAQIAAGSLDEKRNLFSMDANRPEPPPIVADTPEARDEPQPGEPGYEEPEDLEPEPEALDGQPQPTDLRVVLVGTQVSSDARYSVAIMETFPEEEEAQSDQSMYRIGHTLLDDATIIAIIRGRVYFERHSKANAIEYIDIDTTKSEIIARAAESEAEEPEAPEPAASKGDARRPSPPGKTAPPARKPPKKVAKGVIDANRIKFKGGNRWTVPKDMADAIKENPKLLKDRRYGQPPKLTPYYKGGKIAGFKLVRVDPNSIYGKLGIRRGDIISNVNGQVIDKPQKAMELFNQLGPGGNVELNLLRKGRPTTLYYGYE